MEMMELTPLTHNKHVKLVNDYEATASAARLLYVCDKDPGISRVKKKNGFSYYLKDKEIKEVDELNRIQKLAIPPAWDKVWICPQANGHIQATGYDIRGR